MQNAAVRYGDPARPEKPRHGGLAGMRWFATETPAATGTDAEGAVDDTAAYVTLLKKGTDLPLGTYLVCVYADEIVDFDGQQRVEFESPQQVTADGKNYEIALRFQRTYKPYAVQLLDARKDNYPGTDTPRNFSSDIQPASTR